MLALKLDFTKTIQLLFLCSYFLTMSNAYIYSHNKCSLLTQKKTERTLYEYCMIFKIKLEYISFLGLQLYWPRPSAWASIEDRENQYFQFRPQNNAVFILF